MMNMSRLTGYALASMMDSAMGNQCERGNHERKRQFTER